MPSFRNSLYVSQDVFDLLPRKTNTKAAAVVAMRFKRDVTVLLTYLLFMGTILVTAVPVMYT